MLRLLFVVATLYCLLTSRARTIEALLTDSSSSSAQHLLDLLSQSSSSSSSSCTAVWVPGVHDALSARIMVQDGDAKALFLSGFGTSAAFLGQPDAGIVTYAEMEIVARHIVSNINDNNNAVLLVDGDTGYGSAATLRRAVRGMASVGAAAITIEDQAFPKRCTYLAGNTVRVVNRQDSLARIRTALAAKQEAAERNGKHILIVGRTDCRAALGLDEAIERCLLYQQAGCDIVYAENLQSPEEYQKLRQQVEETPLMLAQVQNTSDNNSNNAKQARYLYSLQDVSDLGYQLALFGITGLQATVHALQGAAREMKQNGFVQKQPLASFEQVKQVVDYADLQDFESSHDCH